MIDSENGMHPATLAIASSPIGSSTEAQNGGCLSQKAVEMRKIMKPWQRRETDLQKEFYWQSREVKRPGGRPTRRNGAYWDRTQAVS